MKGLELDKITQSARNKIVAVEPDGDRAVLFIADGDKRIREEIPFRPFLLLAAPELLNGAGVDCDFEALSGGGVFRCRANFRSEDDLAGAVKFLKDTTGRNPSAPTADFRVVSDRCQQVLIAEKIRLFRDMDFSGLRRLQFDIETVVEPGFEFSNPEREGDRIIIISFAFSNGETKVLSLENMSEKELLEEFVKLVREYDPDVLEGHNIFRFDLPFIEARARRHKVALKLGRDGKPAARRNSRFSAAERTVNYTRYDLYGRHVVDTYHLTLFYDVIHRNLDSYGLKYVARHFGVAAPNRTYIEGKDIARAWTEDRQSLLAYAADDVIETRSLANILLPSYFYQAQLIPMKFQDCVVRGSATTIDSMLLAEYLNHGRSLPRSEMSRGFEGGLTQAFKEGVFCNVWHCDVRSLYPSIILAEKWVPSRDSLQAYPRLLSELRTFRLEAKDAERRAASPSERDRLNALQTTFKILINSFYGYLGFSMGTFNDYEMAENVTARGREILTMMMKFLEKSGAVVIEMDTDGIYFQPPPGVADTALFQQEVQKALPEGIEVELDATYPAMFGYKSKNYALLTHQGEVTLVGAALKSRGLEPFQRDFIYELVSLLLHGKGRLGGELIERSRRAIENREWPLDKFAKSETLGDSLDSYKRKLASGTGRRSAAYELAIASGRDYRAGDQVSFYITGGKKKVAVVDNSRLLADAPAERDENIAYYQDKLDELVKKFAEFIDAVPADDLFA
jgi:DNA polymerase elongation subunit (family B)